MSMIEDILVRMGFDGSSVKAGLADTEKGVKSLTEGFSKFGLGSVASLAAVGKYFIDVVNYAGQLTGKLDENQLRAKAFSESFSEIKKLSMDTGVQLVGIVNSLGEWWGKQAAILKYGEQQVAVTEQIDRQTKETLAKLEAVKDMNAKIGEQKQKEIEVSASTLSISEKIRAAQEALTTAQEAYQNAAGDIYEKKKLELDLQTKQTDLAKLQAGQEQERQKQAEAIRQAENQINAAKLEGMTHQEKINYWTQQYLDAQVKITNAVNDEAAKGKATIEQMQAKAQLEKERMAYNARLTLDAKDRLELTLLEAKATKGLSDEESNRLAILRLQIRAGNERLAINDMMKRGGENLTDNEKAILAAHQKQYDLLLRQIEAKKSLISATNQEYAAEQNITSELEQQVALRTKVGTTGTRENYELSDAELEEKIKNLKKIMDANYQQFATVGGNSGYYGAGSQAEQEYLKAIEEQKFRKEFEMLYALIGEAAYDRYSAFERSRLESYVNSDEYKKNQKNIADTLDEMNERLKNAGFGLFR